MEVLLLRLLRNYNVKAGDSRCLAIAVESHCQRQCLWLPATASFAKVRRYRGVSSCAYKSQSPYTKTVSSIVS
jgi:hypothetical protein